MLDDFMLRATLAGLGLVLAAAPLGCFVVWRRMAYIGDATAHASILGVAIALGFSISVFASVLAVALLMAILVSTLSGRNHSTDSLLGVLSHSALAFGLVAISFIDGVRVDLMAYLFGEILAVTTMDLAAIWGGAAVILALLVWRWSLFLTSTLSPGLAYSSGIDPKREQLILTIALALVVAVAIKVVGVLLVTAMLIMPAAAARPFAKTPESMAFISIGIGAASVILGLQAALIYDTPAGPTIVCVVAIFFAVASLVRLPLRSG
ncbi:metal ABC transporter permease [Falsihalocynthiibacter sp. S25ZX9]|uniref:metal ABC transporter permease n=1 Tax=Falsihalocynthiibacter sp. S25ZX9 TaxID=3240870 RepID=UPI00350F6522